MALDLLRDDVREVKSDVKEIKANVSSVKERLTAIEVKQSTLESAKRWNLQWFAAYTGALLSFGLLVVEWIKHS